MNIPENLRYTKDHEWVNTDGGTISAGVTQFAVEQLGDITLVELPEVGTEIKAGEQGVNSVSLKDTKTGEPRELATDGVFIFIGFDPNNKLVPAGTKMNADGYVMTDEKCETNFSGIYVIGDLREKYARQIVIAAADGCTAALAAAHYVEAKKAGDAVCQLPDEFLKTG